MELLGGVQATFSAGFPWMLLLVMAGNGIPSPLSSPTPGTSPSCSVLIVLLALVMVLSGVLLWLNLKRRCIAAAQAGGDSPIPVCSPSPSSLTPSQPPQNPGGWGDGGQPCGCQSLVTDPCPLHLTARRHPRDHSTSAMSFQPTGGIYLPTKTESPEDTDTEMTQLTKEDVDP